MYNPNHRRSLQRSFTRGATCSLLTVASILVLVSIAPQLAAAQSLKSMAQKLKIPDVIPINSGTSTIKIELNGNVVKPGDAIPARNFKNFDIIKGVSWDADYDTKYTLMLLDLDRKSENSNVTNLYNQYTNLNIPGSAVGSGQVIVAFDLPNIPCQASTKHRLAMLAFQQGQTIDLVDIAYMSASSGHSSRRELTSFQNFIDRHNLKLAAANVFQALGEAGVCSSAGTLYPNLLSLSSIIVVMVMFQLVSMRRH